MVRLVFQLSNIHIRHATCNALMAAEADVAAERLCIAVRAYLRSVGQLGRYDRDDVLEHIDACIAQKTTSKVFVSRYFAQPQVRVFVFYFFLAN